MNKSRSAPNKILFVSTLLISIFTIVMTGIRIKILQTPVAKRPIYDEGISPKINEYLVNNRSGILASSEYDQYGNLTRGQAENYCKVLVNDYDDEYIYTYVLCQEYGWAYYYDIVPEMDNGVRITRSLVKGTGWSSHVRFKYQLGTDFKIIDFDLPRGGATYHSDLLNMFGKFDRMSEPSMKEQQEIWDEILDMFRNKQSDWPGQIVRLGDLENPKVIIGGEVY